MFVWRLLKHISAPSSKRVGDIKKCFWVTCQVLRELPFGDIVMAQWLTTRPVEPRVCMYLTNRLFFVLTLFENALIDSGH